MSWKQAPASTYRAMRHVLTCWARLAPGPRVGSEMQPLESRHLLASIAGFVFDDLNVNGIRDPGETGVAGVRVHLFSPGPNGRVGGGDDVRLATRRTGKKGNYSFKQVDAGAYILRFAPPNGFGLTPRDQGNDDSNDSDPIPGKQRTDLFTVAADENADTWSAGIAPVGLYATQDGEVVESINVGTIEPRSDVIVEYRLTNVGPPVNFTQVRDPEPQFGRGWDYITNLNGATLGSGEFIDMRIRFRTGLPGQFGGTGSFVPAGSGSSVELLPNVTGVVTGPQIDVSDPNGDSARKIDFGRVRVGKRSKVQEFALNNGGNLPVTVTNLRAVGPTRRDYRITVFNDNNLPVDPASFTIPEGETFKVAVVFRPRAAGNRSANIKYNAINDDIDQPLGFRLRLIGRGR